MDANVQPVFLYVEDDLASRRVVEVLIRAVMGHSNVTVFDSSANIMQRIDALPSLPDVIFLDVQMTPYDGYQVLEMLRSDPRFANTTVIAMTANVMSYDVEKLRKEGFSGLIGKPVMKESFPDLVRRILAGEAIWYIP